MEFQSVADYVLFNPNNAPPEYRLSTLPWIPAEYPMHRLNFLETLRSLGIHSISQENRNSGSFQYYSFTLPNSEKMQIYEALLSLLENYKDSKVISKKHFFDTLGWYLIWPLENVGEGTPLKNLIENSQEPDAFYATATPSLMYFYDTGRAILINPYLESLDINYLEEGLEGVIESGSNLAEIFINPRYGFTYIEDYSAIYLGLNLLPRIFKMTLNYPQAQY